MSVGEAPCLVDLGPVLSQGCHSPVLDKLLLVSGAIQTPLPVGDEAAPTPPPQPLPSPAPGQAAHTGGGADVCTCSCCFFAVGGWIPLCAIRACVLTLH